MAKKPNQSEPKTDADDILADFAPDPALDGAIDDLRGVLQNDAEGTLPDFGGSTDFDFDASAGARWRTICQNLAVDFRFSLRRW